MGGNSSYKAEVNYVLCSEGVEILARPTVGSEPRLSELGLFVMRKKNGVE